MAWSLELGIRLGSRVAGEVTLGIDAVEPINGLLNRRFYGREASWRRDRHSGQGWIAHAARLAAEDDQLISSLVCGFTS